MRRCLLVPLVVLFAANLAAQGQSAPKAGQSAPKTGQSTPKAGQPAQQAGGDPQTQTKNLAEYAELLRSDVRAQKVAIITEVMDFTDEESAAFWPIYRDYDLEMSKLGDERVALIADYARNYDALTDDMADKLATRAMDLETRRNAAKAKAYDRVKKALSPKRALQFLQVEQQLLQIIDLQISASLPIAK
jgi:hypothetical protein